MITYRIEFWNSLTNKYINYWEGSDFEMAEKMYDKPYIKVTTRRMIKIEEEILYKDKGSKK